MGAVVRTLGLLGLLAAIAALGILGVRVLDGTDDAVTTPREADPPSAPGEAPPGGGNPAPAPPADAADAASCAADIATVGTAAQAFQALNGRPPASVEELVGAGLLEGPVDHVAIAVTGGEATVVGTGPCAAG